MGSNPDAFSKGIEEMSIQNPTSKVKPEVTERTRLEWAQWMASKGLSVFIVRPGEKKPLGGNSWMLRHSTDPQQIAEWFDMTENANYGVWPGDERVVIDLDTNVEIEYQLVASEETDVPNGKISTTSPIGRSFMGKTDGDTAEVQTPGGRKEFEIVSFTTIHDKV